MGVRPLVFRGAVQCRPSSQGPRGEKHFLDSARLAIQGEPRQNTPASLPQAQVAERGIGPSLPPRGVGVGGLPWSWAPRAEDTALQTLSSPGRPGAARPTLGPGGPRPISPASLPSGCGAPRACSWETGTPPGPAGTSTAGARPGPTPHPQRRGRAR